MNSITNYSHDIFNLKLSEDRYYDFKLMDKRNFINIKPNKLIDLRVSNNTITNWATWSDSVNEFDDLTNYGLTALDNGSIPFDINETVGHNMINNPLTSSGDLKFKLREVNGYKNNLSYKILVEDNLIKLRGGFLQGFYKLPNYNYQTLPNRFKKGWTISTKFKPLSNFDETDTLNERSTSKGYDNSGYLFYIGSRAENKFWNTFEGETTYDGVVEEDFIIPLNPPRFMVKKMHNQFLIYGRSSGSSICSDDIELGFSTLTADDITQGKPLIYKTPIEDNHSGNINPFLKYGRSSGAPMLGGGETPHVDYIDEDGIEHDYGTKTADDDKSKYDLSSELDLTVDITDNAIGFRVTEDGRFGYRRIITPTCETENKFEIKEEYTEPNLISVDIMNDITIKWVTEKELICDDDAPREGKLYIYKNGLLITVFEDFKEIINKELQEHKDKQLGVPFNISIGGGTQGLSESLTFDGPDPSDENLPLENNFAGTFIGDIESFIMYDTPMSWCQIKNEL